MINATHLEPKKIVEKIDRTEMLKPIVAVRGKAFEGQSPVLEKLWMESEEAHPNH